MLVATPGGTARLVWAETNGAPGNGAFAVFNREARLTMNVTDLLQSTSAVIDLFDGDVLERGTYLPSGVRETRTLDEAQEAFPLEPLGFTGKEDDLEVGLMYFGHRYLMPHLGRWASPDPLQIHAGGGGEFGNSYHYVSGNLLQARDPDGLRIRIIGSAEERAAILRDLQQLTEQVLMIDADGYVRITGDRRELPDGQRLPAGTALVHRLVMDQDRTAEVHMRDDQEPAGSEVFFDDPDGATLRESGSPSTGSSAQVRYDRDQRATRVVGTDAVHAENEPSKPIFDFAHELSHADRGMRGIGLPDSAEGNAGFTTESGRVFDTTERLEETDVIGIDTYNDAGEFRAAQQVGPDGIRNVTENDIRSEHGARPRLTHFDSIPEPTEAEPSE